MLKKQFALLFALVLTFPLAMAVVGQQAPAKPKQDRWDGTVIRSSKENSTLTVRKVDSPNERGPFSTTARRDGSVRITAIRRSATSTPVRLKTGTA